MGTTTATYDKPLDAVLRDEPVALSTHFDRHHAALWRFALRLTSNPDDAHDAVQETFLRALKATLPREPRAVEAWLMQTLVNHCRDQYRRQRVRRLYREHVTREDRSVASPHPESEAHAQWLLDEAIRSLSVRRRAVLVLHELEGRKVAEIAGNLGIREATVRWHLALAKRCVREALGALRSRDED